MSLGILGGKARGFEIKVPAGDQIRPTSVMLRRRLFDARQDLSDHIFVDLCAGTGAVGIEAWSRGAEHVYLYENNKKVIRLLQDNLKRLTEKFNEEMNGDLLEVIPKSFDKFLSEKLAHLSTNKPIIIFFDPPYEIHKSYDLFFAQLPIEFLKAHKIQIWIESDRQKGPKFDNYEVVKSFEIKRIDQGTQFVSILQF